jgi:hypothetical protein
MFLHTESQYPLEKLKEGMLKLIFGESEGFRWEQKRLSKNCKTRSSDAVSALGWLLT